MERETHNLKKKPGIWKTSVHLFSKDLRDQNRIDPQRINKFTTHSRQYKNYEVDFLCFCIFAVVLFLNVFPPLYFVRRFDRTGGEMKAIEFRVPLAASLLNGSKSFFKGKKIYCKRNKKKVERNLLMYSIHSYLTIRSKGGMKLYIVTYKGEKIGAEDDGPLENK